MPENNPEDFLATARKRWQNAADDEKLIRDEALTDLKYVAGDQWDPTLRQQRIDSGRPALTFPRCHTFVQQVSNEARQNKPQIKFAPGDDQADDDTAEIYEGLARHIQYSSDAQVAYETAVEYSAGGSFGYYRFLTDYCDDNSDSLEIKIMPVLDPFAVYGILIPSCFDREPKFGFVIEDIPTEEFKDTNPKSPITVDSGFDHGGISAGWIGTDTIRVAEYWYCTDEKYETSTGRKRTRSKVHFTKMTWAEEMEDERTKWLGYCIPIIPVLGKGMIVQGKPKLFSVVRFQRDAQQMVNYGKTRIAETLATAPISPYMVAEGQIVKGDPKWETLNTKNHNYLTYRQLDSTGKPAPPPQRQTFEPPIQALSEFVAQEIDDMKATTGIFDASLGQKSNETSGTAIIRRQQQSNMTTMHFMDNLERAFKKGGLVLEDLIPKIYDEERMIQILGEDEAPKIVRINAMHTPNGAQKPVHYKLGGDEAGKYHVIVTMGRAFSTKRMESFDMMSTIVQGNPQLMPMIGDILFRNSDMAGSDQLAERFQKMLPPNLQDKDESDPAQQAQQLQAQLAQQQQHLQAINAYAQQLEKEKEGKVVEHQAKAQIAAAQEQAKVEIVRLQEATKLAVAQMNASKDAHQDFAEREIAQYKILHDAAHEQGMAAVQRAHESQMAEKQAQIATMQSQQAHAQNLETQQQAAALQPAAGEQQNG